MFLLNFYLKLINNEVNNSNFPDNLKLADITPVLKKGDATSTKNYRPISVLPPVSKNIRKANVQTNILTY